MFYGYSNKVVQLAVDGKREYLRKNRGSHSNMLVKTVGESSCLSKKERLVRYIDLKETNIATIVSEPFTSNNFRSHSSAGDEGTFCQDFTGLASIFLSCSYLAFLRRTAWGMLTPCWGAQEQEQGANAPEAALGNAQKIDANSRARVTL